MRLKMTKKLLLLLTFSTSIVLFATIASAEQTALPTTSQFTIQNIEEVDGDSIDITGTQSGDVIKVYNSSTGDKIGTVTASGSTAQIKELNLPTGSDAIQVTVTSADKTESEKVSLSVNPVPYDDVTVKWNPNDLIITNNVGKADTIVLKNLEVGNVLKVYDKADAASRKLIGQAVVTKGKTEASVSIKELGSVGNTDGKVYITVTKEPPVAEVFVMGAPKSQSPSLMNATNNYNAANTIKVSSLNEGDIVNVYRNDGKTLLGKATVGKGKTEVLFSLKKDVISAEGETVKITVTSLNKRASDPASLAISAVETSAKLAESAVTVTNNAGKTPDKVKVTGLTAGDIITVSGTGVTKVMGTVGASKTELELTVKGLKTTGGTVDVTLTKPGDKVSEALTVTYDAEPNGNSTAPATGNITVLNLDGAPDEVTVSGIVAGDIVKVYKGSTLLQTATALSSSLEIALDSDLGTSAGSIDVTVTSTGKKESTKTSKSYNAAQARSTALLAENVTVIKHSSGNDEILISDGLTSGDLVKIYFISDGNGFSSKRTAGSSSLNIGDILLGTNKKIAITVTSAGKLESEQLILDVPNPV